MAPESEAVDGFPGLPEPAPRRPLHTRRVTCRGHLREDGLWDIDGELIDTKTFAYRSPDNHDRQPGEAAHRMVIRLTVDDTMIVRAAVAAMPATPFAECQGAASPMQGLIGATVGPGWRKAIDAAMGGTLGCTHLRELLAAMATVAYQTIPHYREHERRLGGARSPWGDQPRPHMGKCLAWDFNGPVIARVAPQFVGWVKPTSPARK
jgi:Protein of unknown function (DUF2889)